MQYKTECESDNYGEFHETCSIRQAASNKKEINSMKHISFGWFIIKSVRVIIMVIKMELSQRNKKTK